MQSQIDSVIELLKDGKWHTIIEISRKSKVHEFKIEILTEFLSDYSFLQINKKDKKVKLSRAFADFLKKAQKN